MNGAITLVTGEINSGKTRLMTELYRRFPGADGFVSTKIFIGPDIWTGYELKHLSSGETRSLAYKIACAPPCFDEIFRLGSFSFSRSAFEYAEKLMTEMLSGPADPLLVDEIGPLELSGRGFAPLLTQALASGKRLYITIRTACVAEATKRFQIRDFHVIHAGSAPC